MLIVENTVGRKFWRVHYSRIGNLLTFHGLILHMHTIMLLHSHIGYSAYFMSFVFMVCPMSIISEDLENWTPWIFPAIWYQRSTLHALTNVLSFILHAANILNTLRRNGNVLIAVDTAGRVLELSQLLVGWEDMHTCAPNNGVHAKCLHVLAHYHAANMPCMYMTNSYMSHHVFYTLIGICGIGQWKLEIAHRSSSSMACTDNFHLIMCTYRCTIQQTCINESSCNLAKLIMWLLGLLVCFPSGPDVAERGVRLMCLLHCTAQQCELQCGGVCQVSGRVDEREDHEDVWGQQEQSIPVQVSTGTVSQGLNCFTLT